MVRFLVVGDVHGKKHKLHFKDFDYIIAPGDFCSSEFSYYFFEIIREKKNNPNYNKEWYEIVGKSKAKKLINKSIKDGVEVVRGLDSLGKKVFVVPGNWDHSGESVYFFRPSRSRWNYENINFYKKVLLNGRKNIVDIHRRFREFKDFCVIGYGVSSGPEFDKRNKIRKLSRTDYEKSKRRYKSYFTKMSKLFLKAKKTKRPIIFLTHNVPYNTKLDTIRDRNNPRYGLHYGPIMVRNLVGKFQPLLCIGGHMHENFGKDRIGKTVCLNAGFGPKVNILIDLEGNKIEQLKFHK